MNVSAASSINELVIVSLLEVQKILVSLLQYVNI